MSETKALNARSQSVSDTLQQVLTGDENHHYTTSEGVYEKHLPEHIPMETVKELSSYNRDFTAGSIHATGVIGAKVAATSNGTVKAITATIKTIPGERLDVNFTAKKEGKIPGKDTTYEKYGAVSVTHTTSAGGKGGEIGIAMDLVQAATEAAMKSASK